MGKVGGHSGSVDDIVESELVDMRAGLEEQREGLVGVSVMFQTTDSWEDNLPDQCRQRHQQQLCDGIVLAAPRCRDNANAGLRGRRTSLDHGDGWVSDGINLKIDR